MVKLGSPCSTFSPGDAFGGAAARVVSAVVEATRAPLVVQLAAGLTALSRQQALRRLLLSGWEVVPEPVGHRRFYGTWEYALQFERGCVMT